MIELARYGETLQAALLGEVRHRIAQQCGASVARAPAAVALLADACIAGLQDNISEVLHATDDAINADPDIENVAKAVGDLFMIWQARDHLGLHGKPEMAKLVATSYRRALFLAEPIEDAQPERHSAFLEGLAALRQVVVSAANAGAERSYIDSALFNEFIQRKLQVTLPANLAGAIAALAFRAGLIDEAELSSRVSHQLAGGRVDPADNVFAIDGLARVAPELLAHVPELIINLDTVLAAMDNSAFIALLPHLRLAFSALNPTETDQVAGTLSSHYSMTNGEFMPARLQVEEAELQLVLELDQRLRTSLEDDGLGAWAEEVTQ